ncbi:MAG: hypothetical protein JXJ19_02830 [Elusimicrobia bacterium]|nr:hypothetical protein [Elusimicrobiota bacterium]
MASKYKILKIVVKIMEVMAWIVGGLGVLSFFIILIGGGQPGSPRSMSLVALLVGTLYFAILYTFSGIVKLLLEIAENTRKPQ